MEIVYIMQKTKPNIKNRVVEVLSPFLLDNNLEIYHVEYVKEGKEWYLRVYIDVNPEKGGSPSIEDCEKVSKYLSSQLDEIDAIEQSYYLEVSSPGIDRVLYDPQHYERYKGHDVEVHFYKNIDGKKKKEYKLIDRDEDTITVKDEKDEVTTFSKNEVALVRLAILL